MTEIELAHLVYGKDPTERIVSVENTYDGEFIVFRELEDGSIVSDSRPSVFWFITDEKISSKQEDLAGSQHFKFMGKFPTMKQREGVIKLLRKEGVDYYRIWDQKEQSLVYNGMTYFKGMKPHEVSTLSFDIETNSLQHYSDSLILIITNTFRRNGVVVRKSFCLDEYNGNEKLMLQDWIKWVCLMNPSIILGHNILGFDIPYIVFRANELGVKLNLGRNGSNMRFDMWESSKRVDGSLTIEYVNAHIFGREICDTMFLSITKDALKKFPNYQLKGIIRFLGLEKKDRTFVDASKIGRYYEAHLKGDSENWILAKKYAIEDSDDALTLFDEFVGPYFTFTQSVSKSFQGMINSATGSQINNIMVRSYMQIGHSIAKTTEITEHVAGGISFAVPMVYTNLVKIDLKAAYPSQILRFKLYDATKDPFAHFYEMVKFFTLQRFEYKKKFKETGDAIWLILDATAKIVINSAYGCTITRGLNYNCPAIGAIITRETRAIIDKTLAWASGFDSSHWFKIFREKCGKDEVVQARTEAFEIEEIQTEKEVVLC